MNKDSSALEILDEVDSLLTKAVHQSKHPFHQFTIASFNNTEIEQRTVVLRAWNLDRRSIIFHTDYRSPKIKQFIENPSVSVLFYSKTDKLQLRFKCKIHVHHHDRLSESLYKTTTDSQRDCYAYPFIPSAAILDRTKEDLLIKEGLIKSEPKNNFSACVCNFNDLDLLYLDHGGNLRIHHKWDKYSTLSTHYITA